MNCPTCKSSDTRVTESRVRADGVRRRRYACLICKDAWTVFEHENKPVAADVLPKQPARRKLTTEDAEKILLSKESNSTLAKRFGVSKETIRKVQTQNTYQDVYRRLVLAGKLEAPDGLKFCEACVHWIDGRGCDFGFPDAGNDFASDCYLFRQL